MFWEYVYTRIIDISTLSLYEYALINATWYNHTNDKFQCSKTEELLKNRSDAEIVIKFRRAEKGCGKIEKFPKIEIDGIGYHSCLCHENFQTQSLSYYIALYDSYNKSILPCSGGLMDQPAKFLDIISLFEKLYAEQEKELLNKQKK